MSFLTRSIPSTSISTRRNPVLLRLPVRFCSVSDTKFCTGVFGFERAHLPADVPEYFHPPPPRRFGSGPFTALHHPPFQAAQEFSKANSPSRIEAA